MRIAPKVPLAAIQIARISSSVRMRLRACALWVLPGHAANDRRRVVVVAGRKPTHQAAHDGEDAIGLPGTVVVLDVVKQRGNVASGGC